MIGTPPPEPIAAVSQRLRAGQVTPMAIVHGCLERLQALNPSLNAFITVLPEAALAQAQQAAAELKAGRWRGPLHGIPVGIKDFYDTAGVRTTAAFEHFKERVPSQDAAGVARLKAAGAILIGKTNMHTLGMGTTSLESYFGPVRNPWNREYIAGGSSGGSAAAVASGLCYATLDTDAIGSCRLPAACCGVVGFKGSYGLIDTTGILAGEQPPDEMIRWLNHAGLTTRTVADTALVLNVLAERSDHPPADYTAALTASRPLRIGLGQDFAADAQVSAAFEQAVQVIRGLGYATRAAPIPAVDLSQGFGRIEADRAAIAAQAFSDIDVLLLPTTATTVPTLSQASAHPQALSPANTLFANYYGLPAISVPCGFDAGGLPLGLQIVGKPADESAVLQLAHHYETTAAWSRRLTPDS